MAALLHWKRPLHDLVERIGADDVQAMMRFVLLALARRIAVLFALTLAGGAAVLLLWP